jgi:hypothetical protein
MQVHSETCNCTKVADRSANQILHKMHPGSTHSLNNFCNCNRAACLQYYLQTKAAVNSFLKSEKSARLNLMAAFLFGIDEKVQA